MIPAPRLRVVEDVGRARSAVEQMAADEELLEAAGRDGTTTLRLYTWARPALSLGRFQPADDVDRVACDRLGVEVARRPSGGRALLHGSDLTYALATVRPDEPVRDTYCAIAAALVDGLARLGVDAAVADGGGAAGPACFTSAAGADLRVGERKLCGSAMVRRGRAVLQHGSILLGRLPFDESDVLVSGPDREALRRATVTLEELGATTDPAEVAAALQAGFAAAPGLAEPRAPARAATEAATLDLE